MDFSIPFKFVNKPSCKMRIVNCYSPTNPKTVSNPAATDQFYCELQEAINVPARHDIWILGDFNAKLGKRSDHDFQNGLHKNIGRHGVGRRNENGERLLKFLVSNGLFAANTAFRHSSRHTTTRTGWLRDETKKSFPYFSQIDYVLCRSALFFSMMQGLMQELN
jgi:exonuclease III